MKISFAMVSKKLYAVIVHLEGGNGNCTPGSINGNVKEYFLQHLCTRYNALCRCTITARNSLHRPWSWENHALIWKLWYAQRERSLLFYFSCLLGQCVQGSSRKTWVSSRILEISLLTFCWLSWFSCLQIIYFCWAWWCGAESVHVANTTLKAASLSST